MVSWWGGRLDYGSGWGGEDGGVTCMRYGPCVMDGEKVENHSANTP